MHSREFEILHNKSHSLYLSPFPSKNKNGCPVPNLHRGQEEGSHRVTGNHPRLTPGFSGLREYFWNLHSQRILKTREDWLFWIIVLLWTIRKRTHCPGSNARHKITHFTSMCLASELNILESKNLLLSMKFQLFDTNFILSKNYVTVWAIHEEEPIFVNTWCYLAVLWYA